MLSLVTVNFYCLSLTNTSGKAGTLPSIRQYFNSNTYIFFLAWHYTKARLVNYIAVFTIAICVLAQIVVMAVLDGMLVDYRKRIQGLGAQISLNLTASKAPVQDYKKIEKALQNFPEINGLSPVLENYAVIAGSYLQQPVIVRGIELEAEKKFGNLPEYILDQQTLSWTHAAEAPDPTQPGLIIGYQLANALGINDADIIKGATVTLEFARQDANKLIRQRFQVISRFRSSISYYDRYFVYIPLPAAQRLFSKPDKPGITFASVWLNNVATAGEELLQLKERILTECVSSAHFKPYVTTAEDSWGTFFAAMAHENLLMELVMAFISLANGFAIFAIIYTLVASRIRDIGILRSIGAGRLGVMLTFVVSAFIIGVAGALLGTAGGLALAPRVGGYYEYITGTPLYPPHLFGVKVLPIFVDYPKVMLRVLGAIILALVASIPAAVWAGFKQPLEALRHE